MNPLAFKVDCNTAVSTTDIVLIHEAALEQWALDGERCGTALLHLQNLHQAKATFEKRNAMSMMQRLSKRLCPTLALCLLFGAGVPLPSAARAASTRAGIIIYAADDMGTIFVSQDGGADWQRAQPEKQADIVGAPAVSPLYPSTAYALFQSYLGKQPPTIYRTLDAGLHWQALPGPAALMRGTPAALTAGIDTLYVTTAGGVFAGRAGQAWKRISRLIGLLATDPLRVGALALTNSTQIQLSLNGGTTWAAVGPKNATDLRCGVQSSERRPRRGLHVARAVSLNRRWSDLAPCGGQHTGAGAPGCTVPSYRNRSARRRYSA